jgi:galactokinase
MAHGFHEIFGQAPSVRARAPGRVNLIGDHTECNEGLVLPAPIPRETVVEMAPRSSLLVRAASVQMPGTGGAPAVLEYELGSEHRDATWLDYVRGVTSVLLAERYRIEGFDVRIDSHIPVGAGLASSAALQVALLRALRSAFSLELDNVRLALLARRAEAEFVGAPVGVMDQMVASLATPGEALFIDTRSLHHERLPLPRSADLMVVDAGVPHSHANGEYRRRREECNQAASALGLRALCATCRHGSCRCWNPCRPSKRAAPVTW